MCLPGTIQGQQNIAKPMRVAVAGIAHGHVSWILNYKGNSAVQVVGVFEKDAALGEKFASRFKFEKEILYTDLAKMLDAVKPQAVVAFGSIYDHMAVVEQCAPRGIHVMVEKPLATNMQHAIRMKQLADKHKIHLLTNYETSWYPTTEKTYDLIHDSILIGSITKAVFHHGHEGPKEIGVGPEFFNWLTDPVQNGGGALVDFGCYGANIMTYLMKGEEPISVTASIAQYKPNVYPKVEDEATIIVSYKSCQAIIQASWNWPFSRKDMAVYGRDGYIVTRNDKQMAIRTRQTKGEHPRELSQQDVAVYADPFQYFADVVNGKIKVEDHGLYSLANNVMVIIMPDANTGRRGYFNDPKGDWNYEDFFFQEFMPFVEKTYRIKPDKRFRAISGLSMGGGGSFIYALHRPDLFSAACPLSASTGPLSLEDARTNLRRNNPNLNDTTISRYYSRHSVVDMMNNMPDSLKKSVRWYIDCGDDDFLYEGNSLVHIAMKKKQIPHEFRIREGGHTWTYWRSSLPQVLEFVSMGFHQY